MRIQVKKRPDMALPPPQNVKKEEKEKEAEMKEQVLTIFPLSFLPSFLPRSWLIYKSQ